jgi:hypothetical protein
MSHINSPVCPRCTQVLNRYPNPHPKIAKHVADVRATNLDAHISACGRNKVDQEQFFKIGTSRAHYGQSAHSWNAAVDWFQLTQQGARFDAAWYARIVGPLVVGDPELRWYGQPPISFLEWPHVEVRAWVQEAQSGQLKLVDGPASFLLPVR